MSSPPIERSRQTFLTRLLGRFAVWSTLNCSKIPTRPASPRMAPTTISNYWISPALLLRRVIKKPMVPITSNQIDSVVNPVFAARLPSAAMTPRKMKSRE